MKRFIIIAGKIIAKSIALLGLSILTIFAYIFKVFSVIYLFVAIPVAVLGVLVTGYYLIVGEAAVYHLVAIGICVLMVVFRYLMVPIVDMLDMLCAKMKRYVFAPLFIKSSVRYTL